MRRLTKQENPFYEAILATPQIVACYQPGIQALENRHRGMITISDQAQLQGSIELDECVKRLYPQANRWDYIIGYGDKSHFVEVHSAITSEVSTMIHKKRWLMEWLHGQAQVLNRLPKELHWIASGSNKILRNSSQARVIAKEGLMPKRHLYL